MTRLTWFIAAPDENHDGLADLGGTFDVVQVCSPYFSILWVISMTWFCKSRLAPVLLWCAGDSRSWYDAGNECIRGLLVRARGMAA